MKYHVITEGTTDVAVLKALLWRSISAAKATVAVDFEAAGGWSAAEALARSILAIDREPVALVIDSDTTSPQQIEERRAVTAGLLGLYAPPSQWVVVVMVPMIEAIFFKDPAFLASVLGLKAKVSPAILHRAKFEPKPALDELIRAARCSFPDFLTRIRNAEVNPLLDSPEIESLCAFLGLQAPAPARRPRRAAGR
jgi:hypothetical protein